MKFAMSNEHLVKHFKSVGLKLELSERSIIAGLRGGSDSIVQIDIQKSGREERFRLFAGAPGNKIQVVGTDKELNQLVLMVQETIREFQEEVPWGTLRDIVRRAKVEQKSWVDLLCAELSVSAAQLVIVPNRWRKNSDEPSQVFVKRETTNRKRHFLMGMDEREHPFVAQLPKAVSTVRDAHKALKPDVVARAKGDVVRQGEWFFVEPTDYELHEIEGGVKSGMRAIEKRVPIEPFVFGTIRGSRARQNRGNPHTADELIVLIGVTRARTVFVRGSVRHVDHDPVKFPNWRKVIRNTEEVQPGGAAPGIGWVD